MPIRLGDSEFTAHIVCDGKDLEAYDIVQEDDVTVSCWIASEEGKEFVVEWGDEFASTTMQIIVRMDGRIMSRQAHRPHHTGCADGAVEGAGKLRHFTFSRLVLTDDEEAAASNPPDADLGTIEVQMRSVAYYTENTTFYSGEEITKIGPVHEKTKKGGVHSVSLGDVKTFTPKTSVKAHGLQSEPFAVFKFRYRPIDLLRANGIAPALPRPKKRPSNVGPPSGDAGPSQPKRPRTSGSGSGSRSPAPVKPEPGSDGEGSGGDDDEDDDDDRAVFLEEQIAMLQSQLAQEKKKKKPKIVKREPSPIHVPARWTNEVIDLT